MSGAEQLSADDEAVHWFVTLRDDAVTAAQVSEFEAWRGASAANGRAWIELERMWGALGSLRVAAPAEPVARRAIPSRAARGRAWRMEQRPRARRWIAAAAVVLVAMGLGWVLMPVGLFADHRTAIGERRTIALSDGSEVELASESALDVSFDGARRKVTLLAGEAFFTVAKDAARPFVVAAQGGEITVRGTAFDVKLGPEVAVAVTHNSVDVASGHAPVVRVEQGSGVRYDARRVTAAEPVDLDAVQAWRNDQLVFVDTRLADVLRELQRYRRGYVQLLDREIGERRITAAFDTRDPDAALEAIASTLDLRLYRASRLLIGIAPK